ncbi:divisome protein SepX/GlpR [Nocardioides sp. SYSU DS0663]|uniref:divisome protein SepX/GlpR n=1 Tax=Nocardioides sp. SYSU DS0663 TaxID=3416445 RepID=UPI003F4BF1FA
MDLSALIFVALAVAWAVYLIPKALKHHDDVQRSRSVDRFSDTMRVLARREPVDRRSARLVVTPGRPAQAAVVVTKPSARTAKAPASRRAAAARAARRRRRVLGAIVVVNAVVVALAATAVLSWWWLAGPVALLVAWLVACRLMVRQERGIGRARTAPAAGDLDETGAPVDVAPVADDAPAHEAEGEDHAPLEDADTQGFDAARVEDQPVLEPAEVDPSLWEPLPVTLPTYVTKSAAPRRTVRTIDLDATGVWTSGRTDADAALAREADDAARAAKSARDDGDHRAVGT